MMNPRFSLLNSLLSAVALLCCSHSAQARCGETLDEVKSRYGEPIAVLDKKYCEESDNGTYVFLVKVKKTVGAKEITVPGFDVRLVIEFKNSRAWLIRYTSTNLNEAYRKQLLDMNGDNALWSQPIGMKGQKRVFWRDIKNNNRFATAYQSKSVQMLQIVDGSCRNALAKQRDAELQFIADNEQWTPKLNVKTATQLPAPVTSSGAPAAPSLNGL